MRPHERTIRGQGRAGRLARFLPGLVGLLPALVGLLVGAGCDIGRERGETQVKTPRPVTVLTLRKTDPSRTDRIAGSVASWKTEEIGFQVSGRVTFVIEAGSDVRGKQFSESGATDEDPTPLARIDPNRYALNVASIQAEIRAAEQQRESLKIEIEGVLPARRRAAEADRDLANTEVKRNEELVAQKAAPQRMLDQARAKLESTEAELIRLDAEREAKQAELASADARLDQLAQSLAEARLDLEDCVLYSPYPGQVADVHVIPGAFVNKGQRVVTVQLMNPVVVEFEVARETLRRLNYRDMLTVHIPQADGTTLRRSASVYTTDPVADAQTRTFTVTLLVNNQKIQAEVPADRKDQPLARTDNIWRLVQRDESGQPVLYLDENSFQQDASGHFIWKITNRQLTTLAGETSPLLQVSKVRVTPGERRVSFLDLYTFQELTVAEGESFDVDQDLVTGGVNYPPGSDAGSWQGDQILFDRPRWMLRPGDLVGVDLTGRSVAPGFYVPLDAILERSGKTYVFVVDSSGDLDQARQVEVEVGSTIGSLRRIEAREPGALEEGRTRIVADGALFLMDGEALNVTGESEVQP